MSKFCPHCGTQLDDNAKFCRKCGTSQYSAQQGQPSVAPGPQVVPQVSINRLLPPVAPVKDKKGLMMLAGVVVVALLALAFYFLYWVKTPAYSLNIIRKSVQEHNLVTFEQHVDLRSLYSHGMDDILRAYMRTQGTSSQSDSDIVTGLYSVMKGSLVDGLVDATREYVQTGKFDNGKHETPVDIQGAIKQGVQKEIAKDVTGKDKLQLEFKGIESTVKQGQTATVTVKIGAKNKTKILPVQIKMQELVNGEWQVKEIANLSDILLQMTDASVNNSGSAPNTTTQQQPAQTNGLSLSASAVRALDADALGRKKKEVAETWSSNESMSSINLVEHWILNAASSGTNPRNMVYMVYRIQAQNANEGPFEYYYYFKYYNVDAQGNAEGVPSLPKGEYDSGEAFTTGNHVRGQCNYYTGYRRIEALRNKITADAGSRYNVQRYSD